MQAKDAVIYTDLDGTLFHDAGYVSEENKDAIRRFIAAGGMFGVSTGRNPQNSLVYLKDIQMNAPSIMINGTAVYDFETEQYSNCRGLNREVFDPILMETFQKYPGIDVEIYTEGGINYCCKPEDTQPDLLAIHHPHRFVTFEEIKNELFFKALIVPKESLLQELFDMWQEKAGKDYWVCPATTTIGHVIHFFEILPYGISKGTAVDDLRSHPKIAGRKIISVGDYYNDIDLLKHSDIAVAPENAIQELKDIADYMTVSNNEHVIRDIVDNILPKI